MKYFYILVVIWAIAIVVALLTKRDVMIVFSVISLSFILGKILDNNKND